MSKEYGVRPIPVNSIPIGPFPKVDQSDVNIVNSALDVPSMNSLSNGHLQTCCECEYRWRYYHGRLYHLVIGKE